MDKFKVYKEMMDIDYYVYFTKAYFAYNAYLKENYPKLSDLDKNKRMKENIVVRNKFRELIKNAKHYFTPKVKTKLSKI